jgi:hypothetical protein
MKHRSDGIDDAASFVYRVESREFPDCLKEFDEETRYEI